MFIASLLTYLVGITIFLFIFWKRLKEDYSSEVIFKIAFQIIFAGLIGVLVSYRFFPDWFFWSGFLGITLGLTLSVTKYKVRFYEALESTIIAMLPLLSLSFLIDSVFTSSLFSFISFLVVLLLVFVAYFLDTHYKNFSWYKSGKIGFAGLTTLGLIFIARTIVAIFGFSVLSFVGKYEAVVSAVAAFVCFLLLFNLSRLER